MRGEQMFSIVQTIHAVSSSVFVQSWLPLERDLKFPSKTNEDYEFIRRIVRKQYGKALLAILLSVELLLNLL
jgi:hypothetical protein